MNKKLLTIREASEILGVATSTLRRWEKEGKLIPDERTKGGQRRYKLSTLLPEMKHKTNYNRKTIAYARVSSHEHLERQKQLLKLYCASNGWEFEIISDLGSGINYNKKGLKTLINAIIDGEVGRLVITHKDRLLRFGAELIFAICEAKKVEIVIINKGEESTETFEEELAKDVLEIITLFSVRLYGARSDKNKKLIDGIKKVIDDVSTQD